MINDIKLASRFGLHKALDKQNLTFFLNKMLQSGKATERSETKRSFEE